MTIFGNRVKMWLNLYWVLAVLWTFVYLECEGTNANFNNQIRDYAITDDGVVSSKELSNFKTK